MGARLAGLTRSWAREFGREGLESWLGATSQLQAVVDDGSPSRHRPALNTFSWFFEITKTIRFPEKGRRGGSTKSEPEAVATGPSFNKRERDIH